MAEGHRERMRSRFLKFGSQGLMDHEMLELLLYFCNKRQDTNPIAHRLIDRFGTLFGVLSADIGELQEVKGVGEQMSLFLKVVGETMRKAQLSAVARKPLASVGELSAYCYELLAGESTEQFYVLLMDVRFNLITTKHMATGIPDQVTVYPRQIAEAALRNGAANVVLVHNHPAGNCAPSPEDILTTERVQAALEALSIHLVEHMIVTDEEVYAIKARNSIGVRKAKQAAAAQSTGLLDPELAAQYLKTLDREEREYVLSALDDN